MDKDGYHVPYKWWAGPQYCRRLVSLGSFKYSTDNKV